MKKIVGYDYGAMSWQVIDDGRFVPKSIATSLGLDSLDKGYIYSIHSNGAVYLLPDGVAGHTEVQIGAIPAPPSSS